MLALAAVKGLLWTVSLPPWYGPDEPSHFDYVQRLALDGQVPLAVDDPRTVPPEVNCSGHRMGFRSDGPFFTQPIWGRDVQPPCPMPAGQDPQRPLIRGTSAGNYSPLYYLPGVAFYDAARDAPVEVRLHAVRLWSWLLGVAAAGFTYLAALWFFARRRAPAAATALLFTLQPMASQQFAVVSNDALLICVAAAFFWRFFRALTLRPRAAEGALLGFLAGLDYLAKPQGALLAATLVLVVGAHRATLTAWGPRLRLVAAMAVGLALPVLVGVLGGILGHGGVAPGGFDQPIQHRWRDFVAVYMERSFHYPYYLLMTSFWGTFSWLNVPLPALTFPLILAAYPLALAGLVIGCVRRRLSPRLVTGAVASVAGVSLLVAAVEGYYFHRYGTLILQGRSFLFLLPAGLPALAGGLLALAPAGCRRWAPVTLVLAALGLNVFSLMEIWDTLYG